MSNSSSLEIKSSPSRATIFGIPRYTLGGGILRIRDIDYELTPENYKALSYPGYTGKSMKNETDILMMNINIKDLGYTGVGDRPFSRKIFFTE